MISAVAWASTFDAIVALHRGHVGVALDHLAIDPDDQETWWHSALMMYRAWYAAVWVEAAVLAQRDDAPDRIERARRVVRDNPIASAMVERAAAFAAGNRTTVENLAATFEALGCPYQHERTGVLASMISA